MPNKSFSIAVLCLCVLSVGSCERQRSNPLDPEGEIAVTRPPAPSGVSAEGGVGFIRLSWQALSTADLAGYAIYRASQSDGDYQFLAGPEASGSTFTTGKTTYVDSLDSGGITRFYRVAAVDTTGFSSELSRFVGATTLVDQLPPEPPLTMSAIPDEAEPGRVALKWSPPRQDEDGSDLSGLSGYIVLRAESGFGSPVPIDTLAASQTGYTDVGLKSLTTYIYTVIAFDEKGNSSRAAATAQVTTGGLAVPAQVNAVGGISQVVVSWQLVLDSELLGYNVYRSDRSDGAYVLLTGAEGSGFTTGRTSYKDTDVVAGRAYFYRVEAVGANGLVSEQSVFISAEADVDELPPVAPANVSAVADELEFGRVVVTWSVPQTDSDGGELTGLSGYAVFRSEETTDSFVRVGEPTEALFVDTGLSESTTYFYTVAAIDDSGNESGRSFSVRVKTRGPDLTAPATPVNIAAVADELEFGRVVVTWSVPRTDSDGGELTGLSGYAVFRSEETTDSFVRVGEPTEALFVDTGLSESTTYFYTVAAIDDSGNESGRSFSVRVKPRGPDLTAPATPVNIAAVADELEFGRVVVTWSVPRTDSDGGELTGLSGYAVFRSEETTDSFVRVGETTEAQFADTGLSESTTYFYTVAAIDEAGNESGRSSSVSIRTRGPDLTAPATPENVSVSTDQSDPTRVMVRWNASLRDSDGGILSGLSGYVVLRSQGGGGFAVVDTVSVDVREYEDTSLEQLTVYRYTVSAFDEAGNASSQASSVQVTTGGLAVPGRVVAVGGIDLVVVSWDAVSGSGLRGYNVYRSDRSDGTYVRLAGAEGTAFTTGRTSYEDADVVAGQVYFYRVEAVGTSGVVSQQSVFVSAEVDLDEEPPQVPGNLSAIADETEFGRVVVTWSAPQTDRDGGELTGLDRYVVLRSRGGGGFAVVDTVGADVREYEDMGLEPLTAYRYTVTALDEAGNTSSQASSVQVTTGGLAVPGRVTAAGGIDRVVVNWEAVSGSELQGYNLYRSDRSDGTYVLLAGAEGAGFTTGRTTYEDTDVVAGQVYFYRVEAVGSSGVMSEQSVFVSAEVEADAVPPAAPANVSVLADEVDFGSVSVTWSVPQTDGDGGELTGLSGYAVFRSEETTDSYVRVGETTVAQFADTGLSESTTYFYAVVAIDDSGNESGRSAAVSVTIRGPDLTAPATPENVSVSPDGTDPTRVTVRWNASVRDSDGGALTGLNGYVVLRSLGNGGFAVVDTVGSDVREFGDMGLELLTAYRYTVSAFDEAGNSSSQASSVLVTTGGLPVPGRVAAVGGIGQIVVTWQAASGSDLEGYNLYRSDRSDGTYVLLSGAEGSGFTTGRTSYEDADVVVGQVYFYRVEAVGASGVVSEQSVFVSAEVEADEAPPETPSGLLAFADDTAATITLSWSGSSRDSDGGDLTGLASYVVFRSRDNASPLVAIDTLDATLRQLVDTGLESSTTYFYAVSALDPEGNASPLSTAVSATTPGIDVPTGVDAVSGIKRIDVSWNGSTDSGLLGYNVFRSTRSDQGYTRLDGIEGTSFTTGQTTYVDSGLAGGAIFFYRITIVTNEGESEQSAFVGATAGSDIRAPAAPAFLDGEPVTGDPAALSLEWRAPTTDAGGAELTGLSTYLIYRSDSVNGPFTQVGSSETTSFLDEGLDATTTYFYRVEALDDEGNVSDRSSTVALTSAGVDVPKNVRLSSSTPSNAADNPVVTISWDASVVTKGAVLRYEVQRTQKTSPEDADFTDVLPTSVATSRTDSGVTRGQTYHYRVRMVDSLKRESAWTTSVSVTVSN